MRNNMYKANEATQQKERGQSLVEFAIGLTIMILLLSGIFDVGRAIFTQFALQDAAEEGLVYGIGYPDQCEAIKSRVMENLQNGVFPITPTVTVTLAGAPCGTVTLQYGLRMDVEVSSNFVISMPFLTGQTITLRGTANGTILRPPPGT
jgi:Flp pilus assembly protein TadG